MASYPGLLAVMAGGALLAGVVVPFWRLRAHDLSRRLGAPMADCRPFRLLAAGSGAGLGLLSVLCFSGLAQELAGLVLMIWLVALSWIDLETRLLPDFLTIPLGALGLIVNFRHLFVTVWEAALGAILGYVLLWLAGAAYRKARGRHGLGGGDAKLLGALGAWLGWQCIPSIVLLSAILSILGWGFAAMSGRELRFQAFGPYLATAGAVVATGAF